MVRSHFKASVLGSMPIQGEMENWDIRQTTVDVKA